MNWYFALTIALARGLLPVAALARRLLCPRKSSRRSLVDGTAETPVRRTGIEAPLHLGVGNNWYIGLRRNCRTGMACVTHSGQTGMAG